MIRPLPVRAILPLARVSPSQLTNMRECAHQVLLKQAYRSLALLPPAPSAEFGGVVHKLLELAANGAYRSREELLEGFAYQLKLAEAKLSAAGFAHLTPLLNHVKNSGPKYQQALLRAETLLPKGGQPIQSTVRQTEQWLSDADERVAGKTDAIFQVGEHVQIIDYKSGQLFEDADNEEIKPAYVEQLKLYAYLYFDTHGRYPNQLTLIDLNGRTVDVAFSEEDCGSVYEQALADLERINRLLTDQPERLSAPEPTRCLRCEVRGVCRQYVPQPAQQGWTTDIIGTLAYLQVRSGGIIATVSTSSAEATIVRIPLASEEAWQKAVGQPVRLFSVRCIAPHRYEWRPGSVAYY